MKYRKEKKLGLFSKIVPSKGKSKWIIRIALPKWKSKENIKKDKRNSGSFMQIAPAKGKSRWIIKIALPKWKSEDNIEKSINSKSDHSYKLFQQRESQGDSWKLPYSKLSESQQKI